MSKRLCALPGFCLFVAFSFCSPFLACANAQTIDWVNSRGTPLGFFCRQAKATCTKVGAEEPGKSAFSFLAPPLLGGTPKCEPRGKQTVHPPQRAMPKPTLAVNDGNPIALESIELEHENLLPGVSGMRPEEQLLMSLRAKESVLLQDFGPDYFQVQSVRAQIKAAEELIVRRRTEEKRKAKKEADDADNIARKQAQTDNVRLQGGPEKKIAHSQRAAASEQACAAEEAEPPVRARPARAPQDGRGGGANKTVEGTLAPPVALISWGPLVLAHVLAIVAGLAVGLLLHFFIVTHLLHHAGEKLAAWLRSEVVSAVAETSCRLTSPPQPKGHAPADYVGRVS